MNINDVLSHFNTLKEYQLVERVDDISRYVFHYIFDKSYGKSFMTKDEIIEEFEAWLNNEFNNMGYDFGLDETIPDGKYVDAKLIDIPWVRPKINDTINCHLWLIQIHQDRPIGPGNNIIPRMKGEPVLKRVNAISTVAPSISYKGGDVSDVNNTTTAGIIAYGDVDIYGKDTFMHIIKHEIVHFAEFSVMGEIRFMGYPDDGKFSQSMISEFLADFIPCCPTDRELTTAERNKIALKTFRDMLYDKINPLYSNLYKWILECIFEAEEEENKGEFVQPI